MQSGTPLPIDSFLVNFPVEMPKSAEGRAWQSSHAPDQTGSDVMPVDNSQFEFQAFANFDGDATSSQIKNSAPPQDTTYANIYMNQSRDIKMGDYEADGRAAVGGTEYAGPRTVMQDATSYVTHTNSDNVTVPASNFSAGLPDPGHLGPPGTPRGFIGSSTDNAQYNLTSDNIGLASEYYNARTNVGSYAGSFAPDGHNRSQPEPSLQSEHLRNGRPSALVVIWEGPAFNIPTDVAYKLAKMYGH